MLQGPDGTGKEALMFRHFSFEAEIYCTLDCVPMTVRRKLDQIGLKIGLADWRALGHGERLAICHLPADLADEREALRAFVAEAVGRAGGAPPRELPQSERLAADPPPQLPASLAENARAAGMVLNQTMWDKLDPDERYVLMKLSGPDRAEKLQLVLKEFFTHSDGVPTNPEV